MRSEFEKWFKTTKFYENMIKSITTHEIKAHPFDRTGGKYKSIYVQLAFDSFKHQQSKVDELQKRVDAVKQLIQEYRDPPTEDKTFCHALSIVADELEQALKGSGE